ncbi:MAG: patatin-like phospholipase family protein [Pseudomonadota bacterium]
MTDGNYTKDFDQVLHDEQAWLRQRRLAAGQPEDEEQLAVCFSGGGIRSAVFNLGVLQGLESMGLLKRVDYLSSVSGGGYIASCLTWLRHRLGPEASETFYAPLANESGTVVDWLRNNGSYLISPRGFSIWTLLAAILAGTLLNLAVMVPPMLLLVTLAAQDWLPLNFPSWLLIPGGAPLQGHDGFALSLYLAGTAALTYLLMVLAFAAISAAPFARSGVGLVDVRRLMGNLMFGSIALFAVGMVPVLHSLDDLAMRHLSSELAAATTRSLTYMIPIVTGLITMIRKQSAKTGNGPAIGLGLFLYGCLVLTYHLVAHVNLLDSLVFVSMLGLSVLLALGCDVNLISMHHYYRARMAHAFMPRTLKGDSSEGGDRQAMAFRLEQVTPESGGPFHVLNANMNTTSSKSVKLRGRGGDNFTFSPLYCGATSTGFRRTPNFLNGAMELSTALTISGAALDPNTPATRARPIAFLMALLNIRLGYWIRSPRTTGRRPLAAWLAFMTREMLGVGLNEKAGHLHLSDGAHFENLGLYELLRRRCRFIIASDAGSDPKLTMDEMGKAIQRARVDFRASVSLNVDELYDEMDKPLADCAHALGSVTYADGTTGQILYLRPMMCREMTADLYAFWRKDPAFPNDPTADQFYDEEHFEAYRELGLQIIKSVGLGAGSLANVPLEQLFTNVKEGLDVGETDSESGTT